MSHDEYSQLLAERGTLLRLLAGIPEDSMLVRSGFQARLEGVESRLDAVNADHWEPARARLTFRGRPVVGSHGVFADFGTKATRDFIDAIAAMAASVVGPLGQSGPIPNRDQNQLLITGAVVGSFGFQLEEHRVGQLHLDESPVAIALAQTQELLRSAQRSDDELADAASVIQPRVREAVRTFLDTLVSNEATCAVEYGASRVVFEQVSDVRLSLARLRQDNIHESDEIIQGMFQGFLPMRRTFEFKQAENDKVLIGRVSPSIADPDAINQHLGAPTQIVLSTIRVGRGQPRYVLNQLPEWLGPSTNE